MKYPRFDDSKIETLEIGHDVHELSISGWTDLPISKIDLEDTKSLFYLACADVLNINKIGIHINVIPEGYITLTVIFQNTSPHLIEEVHYAMTNCLMAMLTVNDLR